MEKLIPTEAIQKSFSDLAIKKSKDFKAVGHFMWRT